jgi:hypothetical protein
VQGFSAITRYPILFPRASRGDATDWPFVLTSSADVGLLAAILFVIDRSNVQVAFQI